MATALALYPYDDAAAVLRAWREVAQVAPDTVAPEIALWNIPPLRDAPEDLHGAPVVTVAGVYIGPPATGLRCSRHCGSWARRSPT